MALYACDPWWWDHYEGCPAFTGEKWSTHEKRANEKLEVAAKYGLRLVQGRRGDGFSFDPSVIHYGSNSGFQAINLALHFGGNPIVLVGFDMRKSDRPHFFGKHPAGRPVVRYENYVPEFQRAAKMLPPGMRIINCTPDSAIRCFPMARLEDVLVKERAA